MGFSGRVLQLTNYKFVHVHERVHVDRCDQNGSVFNGFNFQRVKVKVKC